MTKQLIKDEIKGMKEQRQLYIKRLIDPKIDRELSYEYDSLAIHNLTIEIRTLTNVLTLEQEK